MTSHGSRRLTTVVVVIAATLCARGLDAASRERRDLAYDWTMNSIKIQTDGDVVFGGLFPMHEAGRPPFLCGPIKKEKGIQRVEAMLYAIDLINADEDLLPNVTVGVEIKDTCSTDTYALEQAMDFIRTSVNTLDLTGFVCVDGKAPKYKPPKPVAGVIGAASSQVSIMVANILRLFKIPQISYASTSSELSDKSRFDYFSRVVPPDNLQAKAMVDIVKALGWKYVSTVAVEGNYGEKGIEAFENRAEDQGLCIATSEKIQRNARPEDFDRVIKGLESKPNARGVILFADEDNCRKLLTHVRARNKTYTFNWIGSDSWGAKIHPVEGRELEAEGAITILPKRVNLPGFDKYFTSLSMPQHNKNVWLKEFWEAHFNCQFDGEQKFRHTDVCTGREKITKASGYEQEGLVPFVVDAVYAMAHAVHNMQRDLCPGTSRLCANMLPISGERLLSYIRNVSFIGVQSNEIAFNEDGDILGYYDLFQYQRLKNGRFDYVDIGDWTGQLNMLLPLMRWRNHSQETPVSHCSDPCRPGYKRYTAVGECCWVCIRCDPYYYTANDTTCLPCGRGRVPNGTKDGCRDLPVLYVTWDSTWAVVPMCVSLLGVVATLFVVVVFVKFSNTPVIMASGRELCHVLLLGIACCYLMSFVILSKPTPTSCAIMRIGLGACLVMCYSAIFTKTNRIARIFSRATKSKKRPSYTSPRSQILICIGLVSVQLVGSATWLIIEEPRSIYAYPDPETVVLRCGVTNVDLIISLVYNMFLIILCTTYAFKTRKIPENFNEAKYIGFAMYSTCIVWLAFVPIYFGTNNDFRIQTTSLCMCVSISASVALGCFFTPKVYLVVFQPYKNVRGVGSTVGLGRGVSFRAAKYHQPASTSTSHFSAFSSRPQPCDVNGEVLPGGNNNNGNADYTTMGRQARSHGSSHEGGLSLGTFKITSLGPLIPRDRDFPAVPTPVVVASASASPNRADPQSVIADMPSSTSLVPHREVDAAADTHSLSSTAADLAAATAYGATTTTTVRFHDAHFQQTPSVEDYDDDDIDDDEIL